MLLGIGAADRVCVLVEELIGRDAAQAGSEPIEPSDDIEGP